jgi:uncharacterized protein DUF3175
MAALPKGPGMPPSVQSHSFSFRRVRDMKTKAKPITRKPAARGKPRATRKWTKPVMERSGRRKSDPFPSAMPMLNFYINRGGKILSKERLRILEAAKAELRAIFGRKPGEKTI